MPRPPKPEAKKRSMTIRFTVTPAESQKIRQDADSRGMEISEYIRSKLLTGDER